MVIPHRFEGKVVLVTGASRGIGEAIALRFASEGADLILCADEERVSLVASEAIRLGSLVLADIVDVSNRDQVETLFERAVKQFQRLDVSVHNAGVITIARLDEIKDEDWDRVMAVNAKGVFLCCQAAARQMIKQGGGRILNAASGQARQARLFTPHYAASKAGVVGLTQSLALELAPFNITVNAYCPGIIETSMWEYNDREMGRLLGGYEPGEYLQEAISRVPLKRAGSTDEVAGLVTFLASEDASYITGQAIHVNGGSIMA